MVKVKIIQGDIHHQGQEDWKNRAQSQVEYWINENNINVLSVMFAEDAKNPGESFKDSWTATITYEV